MTFTRNRSLVAALVVTACFALPASAPADSLPSTYKSDAAQSGYAPAPTVSEGTLPSTYKSDAAQSGYAPAPARIEVVGPERTIVRDVDEPLPLVLSSIALLLVLVGLAVTVIRTRMAPRPGH